MEDTLTFDNAYFRNKIMNLRQKLHALEGFSPVEKISENVPVPEEKDVHPLIKNNEKVNS